MNAADPGLAGVVPFRFSCQRSGRCCTVGAGHVWVEETEIDGLAAAAGLAREEFIALHLRRTLDPRTGVERLSTRESRAGRCTLLAGANHCTVYEARPQHCRSFPYWPSVLASEAGFEAARAVCPGIEVVVDEATRARAFAALAELYAEVDAFVERSQSVCLTRGVCCRFEDAGHELFATGLEADYAASLAPRAPQPEAPGRCPYHVARKCTARAGRPLGCRTYFCDVRTQSVLAEAHEHFLKRLRAIESEAGFPMTYARFPELLARRGVGVEGAS